MTFLKSAWSNWWGEVVFLIYRPTWSGGSDMDPKTKNRMIQTLSAKSKLFSESSTSRLVRITTFPKMEKVVRWSWSSGQKWPKHDFLGWACQHWYQTVGLITREIHSQPWHQLQPVARESNTIWGSWFWWSQFSWLAHHLVSSFCRWPCQWSGLTTRLQVIQVFVDCWVSLALVKPVLMTSSLPCQ